MESSTGRFGCRHCEAHAAVTAAGVHDPEHVAGLAEDRRTRIAGGDRTVELEHALDDILDVDVLDPHRMRRVMVVSKDSRPTSGLHARRWHAREGSLIAARTSSRRLGSRRRRSGSKATTSAETARPRVAQAHVIGSGDRVGRRDDQHLVAVDNGDTGAEGGLEAAALAATPTTTRSTAVSGSSTPQATAARMTVATSVMRAPHGQSAAGSGAFDRGVAQLLDTETLGDRVAGAWVRTASTKSLIIAPDPRKMSRYVSCTVSWRAPFQMSSGIGSSAVGPDSLTFTPPTARCPTADDMERAVTAMGVELVT